LQYKDGEMLTSALLSFLCYIHTFGTINSLLNGSNEELDLAERVTMLEKIVISQRHDGHPNDIRDKIGPQTTSLTDKMESRISALENIVHDQELIIAELKKIEEENHSLKKTVGDLKVSLLEYEHRFQELEAKFSDQEKHWQKVSQNDRHETRVDSPIDETDIVDHKLNNSDSTTMVDRSKKWKDENPNSGNRQSEKRVHSKNITHFVSFLKAFIKSYYSR
jgi:uncharacterized coiled-coil protein SlyX